MRGVAYRLGEMLMGMELYTIQANQHYINLTTRLHIGTRRSHVDQGEFYVGQLTPNEHLYTDGMTACTGVALSAEDPNGNVIVGLAHYDNTRPKLAEMVAAMRQQGAVGSILAILSGSDEFNSSAGAARNELAEAGLTDFIVIHDASGELVIDGNGQVGSVNTEGMAAQALTEAERQEVVAEQMRLISGHYGW